jgi:hypothetical protein
MCGDCGHGWMYHHDGRSGPCYKCKEEEAKSKAVAYKPGKKGWIKSNFGGGLCFTLTYNKLEEQLKLTKKLKSDEMIERVEIDQGGITIYIAKKELTS